jgi:hypothetical protein
MTSRYDQAEVLTALWKLGAPDDALLPTSHGILDRALRDCLDQLPETLKDGLSFGITGVGLRCYELPGILLAAQEALLTSEPNPTYLSSMVTLDEDGARQIMLLRGVSTAKAREIGARLRQSVERVRKERSPERETEDPLPA